MTLVRKTYGKDRVRVLRVQREVPGRPAGWHEVRETTVQAMVTGDFAETFTHADNSKSICTDTVKNIVNIVARENVAFGNEAFCAAIARRLLDEYPMLDGATVTGHETIWRRIVSDGEPQPHGFVLDGNGKPFARVTMTRSSMTTESGISGFTFMKSTQSGWAGYVKEPFTTLKETHDRIAATAMDASWRWHSVPSDYDAAKAMVLDTMLKVFAGTYSHSIQDSLYRMGTAALEAVPEVEEISLACPNKHYLLVNLEPFGMDNDNLVFTATDEPHGQIECTVGRSYNQS
ncbi:MAG TPA: urate oxidase [Geminicoccus sp.]|jgi:urate oxidase|uniref:factor-independent urate hydroxylase n=1 Tax=Geminicoccus sp. TaxID=2024832 RepID=UPI002E2F4142|nr:urate oxidase [Geminicoccus sp.]HEX2528353.1 urate oxidase [Geminicoccus sp.]